MSKRFGRKVWVTWVISYLAILVLPIFSWMTSFYVSRSIIQEQTDTINEGILKLISESADGIMTELFLDLQRVSADGDVAQLIASGGMQAPKDAYNAMRVRNALSRSKSYNPLIDSIYLYLTGEDLIISEQTVASAPLFYRTHTSVSMLYEPLTSIGVPFGEWHAMLEGFYVRDYLYLGDQPNGYVVGVKSLPINASEGRWATLVIQLKPDAFTSILSRLGVPEGMLVSIFSESGALIASNTKEEPPADSGGYISARIESQASGLTYVSLIPKEIYLRHNSSLGTFTLIAVIVVLSLGLTIIAVAIRKNYQPLGNLVSHLELNFRAREQSQNEYAYLSESIKDAIDAHRQDELLLQEQDGKLRRAYVLRLLTGHADMGIPAEEYLSMLGFSYESNRYAVLLFDFDESGFLPQKGADFTALLDQNPLYGYSIEIGGRVAFLADCANLDEAGLRETVRQSAAHLRERFPSILLSASDIHDGAASISRAYDEALYGMDYLFSLGNGNLQFYGDISGKNDNMSYYYPPEEERRFIELLSKGDVAAARELVARVWTRNLRHGSMKLEQARLLMWNFVSSLLKAGAEQPANSQCFSLPARAFQSNPRTVEEMRGELDRILDSIRPDIADVQEDLGSQLRQRVLEYISVNYADSDLSVEKICDFFGRSRSSLFVLFKDKTGDGLLYHINKIRIAAAKKLLTENRLDVAEIARLSGYSSIHTFLRVFKKYEGVTPGKYRDIASQSRT